MSSQPKSQRHEEAEIERLLTQLRRQVAQLRWLERAPREGRDLTTSRQSIVELRSQLARLVANNPDGGHSVAA
jgi:hypothetical protein